MSSMFIADQTGHTTVEWDVVDEATRIVAETEFNRYRAIGYTAYRSEQPDSDGRQITVFDQTAPFITLIPQMVGG